MLLQHPEAIDWLQEEIDALPWPPDPEQLERAERLDAVVKEVMRLIPPVGGLFRRTTAPVRLLGYEIPAGRVIQVNISGTHRDCRVYALPEQFQADRHLRQPLKAPGYIPFGGGPRVCLGRPLAELEVRLLAVRMLQTLRFTLEPDQNLGLEVIPTPRPKDGLLVRVKRRCS
jgi:cytochrome P450